MNVLLLNLIVKILFAVNHGLDELIIFFEIIIKFLILDINKIYFKFRINIIIQYIDLQIWLSYIYQEKFLKHYNSYNLDNYNIIINIFKNNVYDQNC